MFVIVTKSKRLSLPLDVLFELFDRVVLPVVLYASEIYGHKDSCIKKLEIFQRSLYKKALKLSKSTSSIMIYGETGTIPLGYEPADLTVHPPPQNDRGWVHFFCIGV